jgi:hypothetical protein
VTVFRPQNHESAGTWQSRADGFEPRVTLPDTSLAIPRDDQRRDLFPIRPPTPTKLIRRPSLANRRRRHLTGDF